MIGIFAGSFDPITIGHIDLIQRAAKLCHHLVIAIGINSGKKPFFSVEERIELIKNSVPEKINNCVIEIQSFDNLLVSLAQEKSADVLIRGIRSVSDFEYEITLANANKMLNPKLDTIFLPTSSELTVISSSAAKEIARYGHDVSKFVPPAVQEAFKRKF